MTDQQHKEMMEVLKSINGHFDGIKRQLTNIQELQVKTIDELKKSR